MLEKARTLLAKENLDLLIVDNPIDLYYLTGHHFSLGRLAIGQNATLFVDGRYLEAAQKIPSVSTILTKGYGKGSPFAESFASLPKRVGFDASTTTFSAYQELEALFGRESLVPLSAPIQRLRMVKEPIEIEYLAAAAHLAILGLDFVRSFLKEGMIEEEIALELELFWRRKGGQKLAFDTIIASGPNASQPHYRAGKRKITRHEPILVDMGVVLHNYHSDLTRVFFLGEPIPKMREIYSVVEEACKAALQICRPGTLVRELDSVARSVIEKAGYGEYFTHSLGHGVGLEIHELPLLRSTPPFGELPLSEGMVITIEPGIYLPGLGGVRLEDTIAITKEGYRILTNRPLSLEMAIL